MSFICVFAWCHSILSFFDQYSSINIFITILNFLRWSIIYFGWSVSLKLQREYHACHISKNTVYKGIIYRIKYFSDAQPEMLFIESFSFNLYIISSMRSLIISFNIVNGKKVCRE